MRIKERLEHFINLINKLISKNKKEEIVDISKELENKNVQIEPLKEDGIFFIHTTYAKYKENSYVLDKDEIMTMEKLLKHDNFYKHEKEKTLIKIYKDCLEIHGLLIPLMDLGIVYSIDVIGGAIRDFLLNKEIKDLDILIEIDGKLPQSSKLNSWEIQPAWNKILTRDFILEEKNWCSIEELDGVGFNDKEEYWEKVNKLIKVCLNKKVEIKYEELYNRNDRTLKEEYGVEILKELTGLLKVESKNLNYPIEILLTNKDKYELYRNIDFDLCNVGLEIVNKDIKTQKIKLNNYNELINACTCNLGFIKDVTNKKITSQIKEGNEQQLIYSFTKHLPRIQAKYPDYQLDINNVTENIQEKINKIVLFKDLDEQMNNEANLDLNAREEPTKKIKRKL